MSEFTIIGQRVPRADGPAKVTGEARYAGDIRLPGLLIGKILGSPLPHARILNVDASQALRLPGVKAVMTGKDCEHARYGHLMFKERLMDRHPLESGKVRCIGDHVAAVAAVDADTAEEAIRLIKVDYEELPAVFTVEDAAAEGAPLVHDDMPGNVCRRIHFDFGDVDRALSDSYYVREDTFVTQAQSGATLEPHACTASYDSAGKLTIWPSTQSPVKVQFDLIRTLGIPSTDIRVILPYVGGSFGSKGGGMSPLEFCAAFLAIKAGRPVRMYNNRETEFSAAHRRHPFSIWLRTGVSREGEILGRDVRVTLDGGAYNNIGPATILLTGIFLNLPYRYRTYRYRGVRYYTNTLVSGAIRGHGSPQVHFASDVQMDRLAEGIGMDPIDIRLVNALKSGETTLNGFKILSSGFTEALEAVREKSGWREKRGKLPPYRGIGVGCGGFPSGTGYRQSPDIPTYSSASVRLNADSSVSVLCAASDTGQGVDNVLIQIAAEELGVRMEDVRLVRADTDVTPADLGNGSSRETVYAGNAVKRAARDLKEQLLVFAAERLKANPEDLEIRLGRISLVSDPERSMTFKDLGYYAQNSTGGRNFVGQGFYDPPDKINYATYTFGAQVTEVEVDPNTGRINVLEVISAHDCGRAINPMAVEGQLEGSIHLGLGWATTEDLQFENGRALNPNFLEYKLLTSVDTPPIRVCHIESDDPEGPFGAKEAGEGIVSPTAPSLANAVYNATGMHVDSLPLSPEKVFNALKKKNMP